jgi:hypothetical protein
VPVYPPCFIAPSIIAQRKLLLLHAEYNDPKWSQSCNWSGGKYNSVEWNERQLPQKQNCIIYKCSVREKQQQCPTCALSPLRCLHFNLVDQVPCQADPHDLKEIPRLQIIKVF